MKDKLILIGFMGSGKTTIGTRLARTLKLPFIDTDAQIEKEQSCSISTIFAAKGEPFFRQLETRYLKKLLSDHTSQIIATGGGLPVAPENRPILRQAGTVIYLKTEISEVINRLRGDQTRPLLQNENPSALAASLLAIRDPIYKETAHIIIDTTNKTPDEIVSEIMFTPHVRFSGLN